MIGQEDVPTTAIPNNSYIEEIQREVETLDPTSHACRVLTEEIERVQSGGAPTSGAIKDDKHVPLFEIHTGKPVKYAIKVRIPVKEYPKFNFVGKLLGPKGNSLKRLQEDTMTKMSILGKGSMRDKAKEDELRKEGGKYAHLNEDLHVLVEVYSEISDCFVRLSHALSELRKYLVPVSDYNDEIRQQQLQELMYLNGEGGGRGRGRGRGTPTNARGGARGGLLTSPSPRGGGMAGRGAGGPPARGTLAGRGTPTVRGGLARGGMSAGRGRGQPQPQMQMEQGYEDYGYDQTYGEGYGEQTYGEQSYEQSYGQADTQYFDYGHGTGASFDDGGYGEGGWGSGGQMKAPPARGGTKGQYRTHPYGSGRGAY